MIYAPQTRNAATMAADIEARLARPVVDLIADPPADWRCGIYTLRIAGYRFNRAIAPLDAVQAAELACPSKTLPARASTMVLAARTDIALGIMCRPNDLAAVTSTVATLAPYFASVVVLVDDDRAPTVAQASVAAHRLEGDFAAQRNRLQHLAASRWVLQLDADEHLDTQLLAAMPKIAADADRHGLRSLALPRRNVVDGHVSDLWPDVQYRLNRGDVRFAGKVHERPACADDWRVSSLAPVGAIVHYLSGERVRQRSRDYGTMAADGARPEDEAALLRPFTD